VLDGNPQLLLEVSRTAMRETLKAAMLWVEAVWIAMKIALKSVFFAWPYVYPHLRIYVLTVSKGSWTWFKRVSIYLYSLDLLTKSMIIGGIAIAASLFLAKRAKVDRMIYNKYTNLKSHLHRSYKATQAMIMSKSKMAGEIFPHIIFLAMVGWSLWCFGEHLAVISRSWLFPVGAVVLPIVRVFYSRADRITQDIRTSAFWLRYFVALAVLQLLEELPLIRRVPLYHELRCVYAFWLMFPWCQGGWVVCSLVSGVNKKKYIIDSPLLSILMGKVRLVTSFLLPLFGLTPAMMEILEGGLLQLSTLPLGLTTPYYANILLGVVYPMFASLTVVKDELVRDTSIVAQQEMVVFWLRYFISFRVLDQCIALELPGILRWIPLVGWVWKLCRLLFLLWLQLPGLRGADTVYGFFENPKTFQPWFKRRVLVFVRGVALCFRWLRHRNSAAADHRNVDLPSERNEVRSSAPSSPVRGKQKLLKDE